MEISFYRTYTDKRIKKIKEKNRGTHFAVDVL